MCEWYSSFFFEGLIATEQNKCEKCNWPPKCLYQIYNCFHLLAVPDKVEPKYIKGAKWYGRRTRPELQGTKLEQPKYLQEQQSKSQLRRSASLESVEVSLKACPPAIFNRIIEFYCISLGRP